MTCPNCGDARRPRVVLRTGDVRLVACRACTLVRVDPMPSADAAAAQYDDAYFRDASRGYDDYARDDDVFRAAFRQRLETVRRVGGQGRLLDVGCATGGALLEAKALGFTPAGIEPASGTARRAAERSGCPVHAGTLDDALLAAASYDVITAFDVLEHLTVLGPTLRRLRWAVAPHGLLAVTVPDFGGLWARASGARWPFLTPWEHLLYFTRRSLRHALCHAGFRRVTFHPATTPVSLGTLAAKTPLPARWVPAGWEGRGPGLPFGTLFAIAR